MLKGSKSKIKTHRTAFWINQDFYDEQIGRLHQLSVER